ncbi:MAG: MBOAT family protein, partial [Polyangiaceae bacterium]
IFFRAPTFAHATLMLSRIGHLTFTHDNVSLKVILVLLLAVVLHAVPKRWEDILRDRFALTPSWVQGVLLAMAAFGIHLVAGAKAEPFVYGQF